MCLGCDAGNRQTCPVLMGKTFLLSDPPMCSYRGYGRSQGQPNEAGIRLDAQAALESLLQRTDVDKEMVSMTRRAASCAVQVHMGCSK